MAKSRKKPVPVPSFSEMEDDDVIALYNGENCPQCTESLNSIGHLPSYCAVCGADRNGPLWDELTSRFPELYDPDWDDDNPQDAAHDRP